MNGIDKLNTFINGIWSGIPICCTLFFIEKEKQFPDDLSYQVSLKRLDVKSEEVDENGWMYGYATFSQHDYVLCDKCYKANRSKKIRQNGGISISLKPFRITLWHRD